MLAVLFATSSLAQEGSWERLNAQAMDLHRQKRDEEAVVIAQQALALAEKKFSPLSPKLAIAQTNLAEIYRALGRD